MPLKYWNLTENPFQNIQDTRFSYMSDQHKEGLSRLLYTVNEHKQCGILTGKYGVGKTMVLQMLADKLSKDSSIKYIQTDAVPSGGLALARNMLLNLNIRQPINDLGEAVAYLQQLSSSDEYAQTYLVIAVDELQLIKNNTGYEFLHLLTNLQHKSKGNSAPTPFLTLILSGHNAIKKQIQLNEALWQRSAVYWEINPLSQDQVIEYVHHRMRIAGGDIWAFEESSLYEIYRVSGGLPRIINNICNIALLAGKTAQTSKITKEIVLNAIEEINIGNRQY
jgi:general secretion pathway protein A